MKKLFTSFVLALVSYSMVVGQCNIPVSNINENFDAVADYAPHPSCWTVHNRTGAGNTYVMPNAAYSVSGAKCFRIGNASGPGTDVLHAVLPMVTHVGGVLSFYARTSFTTTLEIGTMSGPNDTASFALVQAVTLTSVHQLFTISNMSGTDQYIAFRYNMNSDWIVLDNVVYNEVDPCLSPMTSLVEDMESYPNYETNLGCWEMYASTSSGSIYILDNFNYSASGTKSLRMGHTASPGAATLFAITPKLANLKGILTFQARTNFLTPILVGTMPNNIDTAGFEAFDTIQLSTIYQQFTINFNSYVGADSVIAFKYEMPDGVWVVLDDINYSIGTAISTIVEHQTLNIYPNPASTSITLDTKEIIESVSIYNLNGQLVKFVGQAENIIDIQDLPKGLYIVQAQTVKGIYQNKLTKS